MLYRLAEEKDLDKICSLVEQAIKEMERQKIYQWDDLYPTRADFLEDIQKHQLYAGLIDNDIAVIYALNRDSDAQYKNGRWKYPDSEYRIIHRLCVHPKYQNRGVAKNTLLHIEKDLGEKGVETMRLDVFSNNPFALSLYENSGYERVGSADWRKGRFYLMEKRLAGLNRRIIICGLNGSGKSTLGKALADALGIRFMDNEDYYFPKKGLDYKFEYALTKEELIPVLQRDMEQTEEWVFASVKGDYGSRIEGLFTHAVFLEVPKEIRMRRVWNRSHDKFGDKMLPGGELYERERRFYDMVRNRPDDYASEWMSKLTCPVIRVDGTRPVKENVELLAAALAKRD